MRGSIPGVLAVALALIVLVQPVSTTVPASWLLGGSPASSVVLLSYTLRIDHESLQKRVAHVEAQVSGSSSFSVSFATYAWFGEVYLEIPISNVNATDDKGTPLKVSPSESQQDWGLKRVWSITRGSATFVLFKYDISFEYYIERIRSYAGWIGSDYAVGVGAFTFLVPNNFSPDRIEVRFQLPLGWTIATPWQRQDDRYGVGSVEELATAAFALGDFEVVQKSVEGTNLAVAVYGGWSRLERNELVGFSFGGFEYVASLFRANPQERHLAIYCPTSSDGKDIAGWAESSKSQAIVVGKGWDSQNGTEWKRGFLHRVVHIWNFFQPYAMKAKTQTPDWTNWFAEGSTDYYAFDKALINLGVFSGHIVLLGFFQTYLSDYLGTRYDLPVAQAYEFVNDPERYTFLMYRKGALICFLLDSLLQGITAGDVSFDDVMRLLYEKFGNMHGVYTNRNIQSIAQQLSNQDLSAFFNNYVYGKTKLPLLLQGSDLAVDWPEFLRTVKLSSTTITAAVTTTPSTLVTETVASKSTLLSTLRTTSTAESAATRATPVAKGVFTTEVLMVVGLAFIVLAVVGVFYLRRRGK